MRRIEAVLPDPLIKSDGERVQMSEEWELDFRAHWLEMFRSYVYGREPIGRPIPLEFVHISEETVLQGAAIRK